ncbi:energy transducer TonB [bacterium]|nr:energy transducer TonB [bacterium]
MKKRTLIKTMLVTIILVAGASANPRDITGVTPPRPVGGMQAIINQAQYPLSASENRMEGQLVLSFRVDQRGNVSHIIVVESGGEIFNEAAIAAVRNTTWIPASYNAQSIPIRYELPFRYTIK